MLQQKCLFVALILYFWSLNYQVLRDQRRELKSRGEPHLNLAVLQNKLSSFFLICSTLKLHQKIFANWRIVEENQDQRQPASAAALQIWNWPDD